MGLRYKVKDLIQAVRDNEVEIIAHQCNCFNNMGAGIAPLIAEAFPSVRRADKNTIKGDKGKLGHFTLADAGNSLCFNLYGQYGYGRQEVDTDYGALKSALKGMSLMLAGVDDEDGTIKIGLPKIGAGLGGGDWRIISQIIEEELQDFDVTIYVLDESEIPDG